MKSKITCFNFEAGRIISGKYEVISKVGSGWEGEVYLLKEADTGIERAAKVFYPHRNPKDRSVKNYAKKLHKLRACNSLIKYIGREKLRFKGQDITFLLSEFVEGITLDTYINSYFPRGLYYYQALHIFYAVVQAVEEIHFNKEWHGDIHSENIIIQKVGLEYELKLIDVFPVTHGIKGTIQEDVFHLCHLLYELIGGKDKYSKQPKIIKEICCGLKTSLIKKKFRNATHLRTFLENSEWE